MDGSSYRGIGKAINGLMGFAIFGMVAAVALTALGVIATGWWLFHHVSIAF